MAPLFIQFPVFFNVGVALDASTNATGYLSVPTNIPDEHVAASWVHPGYEKNPASMVVAVARCRRLITRATATIAASSSAVDLCSVPSHVANLAHKWDLAAYLVHRNDVKRELLERGPLLAAVAVSPALLNTVSQCLVGGNGSAPPADEESSGYVMVAIVGWRKEKLVVALPWGKVSIWDGLVSIPADMCLNVCGLTQKSNVRDDADAGDAMMVSLIPPEWNSTTVQPLPTISQIGISGGKHQRLKKKYSRPDLHACVTDEHISITVQCVVTVVVIVVGIILLCMIRRGCRY